MSTDTPSNGPRFAALGIVVSDMSAALAFYRRLGLEFPAGAEEAPHAEAQLPGGLRLMFDTEEVARSLHEGWARPVGSAAVALAFACSSPAEVDTRYAELTGEGAQGSLKPFDAPWGQRYATVLDPDGTAVDLFAPLDGRPGSA